MSGPYDLYTLNNSQIGKHLCNQVKHEVGRFPAPKQTWNFPFPINISFYNSRHINS